MIERSTQLAASAGEVWRHVTSIAGINAEMGPVLRMTAPAEARDRTLDDPEVTLGEPLFASYVLLLGVVPVERMKVTLVELAPGRRFVEESPMLVMRRWRHERSVEPSGGGCRVTDRVDFEPRLAWAARPMGVAVAAFFRHRHRRLERRFGATASPEYGTASGVAIR
jgi:ligand-binding SRPBCC domain-containing protein